MTTYEHAMEKGEELKQPLLLAECPTFVRAGFIRKVYALLSLQVLMTIAIAAPMMLYPPLRDSIVAFPEGVVAISFLTLVVICPLFQYKDRYPINLCFLGIFTILQGAVVGGVCAMYASIDKSQLVVIAFTLTAAIFMLLSVFVHVTRRDFSFMEGFLSIGTMTLVGFGLISVLFSVSIVHTLVAYAGVVIFSGWILYDTSSMIHVLTPDDTILACVNLYLDTVNMFLFVLEILNARSD